MQELILFVPPPEPFNFEWGLVVLGIFVAITIVLTAIAAIVYKIVLPRLVNKPHDEPADAQRQKHEQ